MTCLGLIALAVWVLLLVVIFFSSGLALSIVLILTWLEVTA